MVRKIGLISQSLRRGTPILLICVKHVSTGTNSIFAASRLTFRPASRKLCLMKHSGQRLTVRCWICIRIAERYSTLTGNGWGYHMSLNLRVVTTRIKGYATSMRCGRRLRRFLEYRGDAIRGSILELSLKTSSMVTVRRRSFSSVNPILSLRDLHLSARRDYS